MLAFKCFIFSIFLLLSFGSLENFNGASLFFDSQGESTFSSNNDNHRSLILDRHLKTNQANWFFKTFKTPNIYYIDNVPQPSAEAYNYKLLFLEIQNSIPLKLTPRTIIFPFHFFQ